MFMNEHRLCLTAVPDKVILSILRLPFAEPVPLRLPILIVLLNYGILSVLLSHLVVNIYEVERSCTGTLVMTCPCHRSKWLCLPTSITASNNVHACFRKCSHEETEILLPHVWNHTLKAIVSALHKENILTFTTSELTSLHLVSSTRPESTVWDEVSVILATPINKNNSVTNNKIPVITACTTCF